MHPGCHQVTALLAWRRGRPAWDLQDLVVARDVWTVDRAVRQRHLWLRAPIS